MKFPLWQRDKGAEDRSIPTEAERFLICGLGNPGPKYAANRHNIGFMAVDEIARAHDLILSRAKFKAVFGEGRVQAASVVLVKPQTYMNNSGTAIGQLARFFKIPTERLLVIYDELDLPLGTLRLRRSGGSGGHNGMKSVIQHVGNEFPRLRLGIGRPLGQMPPAAYVLQDFGRGERAVVDVMLAEAVSAVETYLTEGIDVAMTRYNGAISANERS